MSLSYNKKTVFVLPEKLTEAMFFLQSIALQQLELSGGLPNICPNKNAMAGLWKITIFPELQIWKSLVFEILSVMILQRKTENLFFKDEWGTE